MNLANKKDFADTVDLCMNMDEETTLDALYECIRDYEQAILAMDPVNGARTVNRLAAQMEDVLQTIIDNS